MESSKTFSLFLTNFNGCKNLVLIAHGSSVLVNYFLVLTGDEIRLLFKANNQNYQGEVTCCKSFMKCLCYSQDNSSITCSICTLVPLCDASQHIRSHEISCTPEVLIQRNFIHICDSVHCYPGGVTYLVGRGREMVLLTCFRTSI